MLKIIAALVIALMAHVECGACGAHTAEWGYVPNDAHTELVAVCMDCYREY